jgi:TonB family protein
MLRKPSPQPKDVASVMSDTLAQAHDALPPPDRRLYSRQAIRSLAYVELDEGNGGIVLNVSEGGLSVQAVTSLMDELLPDVRFQLSESEGWVESHARIAWTTHSRKVAGLEFINLPEVSRDQIRKWLARESLTAKQLIEADMPSEVKPPSGADAGLLEADITTVLVAEPLFVRNDQIAEKQWDVPPRAEVELPTPSAGVPRPESSTAVDLLTRIANPNRESESVRKVQAPGVTPSFNAKILGNKWGLAGFLAILAAGSLAAGWAAGDGEFGKVFERVHNAAPKIVSAARDAEPKSAIPITRISEIEVVDAGNQRWTIPFDGPLDTPEPDIRRQVSGNASSQSNKSLKGFRTWILAPPLFGRATGGGDATVPVSPPVLANESGTAGNILSASGPTPSQALAGPVTLRKPEPPSPTGIVKRGELIYQVTPAYPKAAREHRVEGTVRLNVSIGQDGVVHDVALLGGPKLLVRAAEEAVLRWRYSPTFLDGKPIEVQREVDLRFHFSDAPR